jgi:glycylpeptide N-tetradecanoyltransferase
MEAKDIDAVLELLNKYLSRFDMAPVFTREEVDHWLLSKTDKASEQVIWCYVVEVSQPHVHDFSKLTLFQDPTTKAITDFFSFYCLESSVINNAKHSNVRAAYLYYYASTLGLAPIKSREELGVRLNALMNDALILAKRFNFDVFNALTLLDNNLFLEQQKFGAGDGQLHFYLYNYNANPIAGGVDGLNRIHDAGSGMGVVML